MNRALSAGFVIAVLAVVPASASPDRKVARKDLPAAVEKTLAQETAGATIAAISSEPCEGPTRGTCYEIETKQGSHSRDLVIDAAGNVVEIEEGVELAAVPEPVQHAAARLGRVIAAEKVTRGSETSYELRIEKARKQFEQAFLADGTRKR